VVKRFEPKLLETQPAGEEQREDKGQTAPSADPLSGILQVHHQI
jgi:hypothetical protein